MDKAHIKLDLTHMSVPDQIAEGRRIVIGITASSLTNKALMAGKITSATDVLENSEANAKLKAAEAQAATGFRDVSLVDFGTAMGAVAGEVEREVNYDGPAMMAIGYQLASTNRTSTVMTQVMNLQLSAGDHAGQLHAQWDPMKGSRTYQIQYQVSPTLSMDETKWLNAMPSSASRSDIDGLPSHQLVWVRVCAIGAGKENMGQWSDAVPMSAQ